MDTIPDATTVALFRERLRNAGLIEELFARSEQFLRDQGLEALRVARLLMQLSFQSQYKEIHAKKTKILRKVRSLKNGRKLQNARARRILTEGGPKE